MPYIPERIIEDKPDTFNPFVPLSKQNKVEICKISNGLNQNSINIINYNRILIISLVSYILYKSLKQYKLL